MELIDREELMKYPIRLNHYDDINGDINFVLGIECVLEYAEVLPTIDAVPVVHGRWILEREEDGTPSCYHCSACDDDFHYIGIRVGYPFCPNCGAKMDGEIIDDECE